VHVHNLLNLSFDLPAMARASGAAVVATLHDYTLVCPSGGQRIHRADEHLCKMIDTDRCARCFDESPVRALMSFGSLAAATRAPGLLHRVVVEMRSRLPSLALHASRALRGRKTTRTDVEGRLAAARRVFDSIDLFVAPSQSIADEFRELGVSGDKLRISDYGCSPLSRSARNGNEAGRRLRIGYVGTLVWHKGVHNLIDAVRGLPPNSYELKIFGNTSVFADYVADLRARAEGLPVIFMGAFDRDDAAWAYAQMDVLVAPSLWLENSPLVIHEAFMAGVPVVGSRIGGIAELIDDGRTGLLHDPASTAELRERLRELIDHPQRLSELTDGARTIPRIKTIAADAGEWERRYAELVRGREPAGPTP
jgi:glycosyltransferase involved in cell wall biosynthesis